MPSDTIVRHATPDDWLAIERLLTSSDLPLDGAREHAAGFVVAERDGGIEGCAALERHGRFGLLRSVAVEPASRGEGVGEDLVRHLIGAARKEGLERLVLLTTTADAWFPRFGFVRTAREAIPRDLEASAELRGACPSTAVVMSLVLR